MDGLLVVREIWDHGTKSEIFLLDASSWTLYEFQEWMFGVNTHSHSHPHSHSHFRQPQRNEILAYYPEASSNMAPSLMHPSWTDGTHVMWKDPDGLDAGN